MQITSNEIDKIEEAGILDNSPVKLIKTKGGFWIAIGRPKGKMKEQALAAGSHPAIVKYNLEKQYPTFQPMMMKSEELASAPIVEKHSHFLSDELRKSGHDIYSVQVGDKVDFHLTKYNMKLNTVSSFIKGDSLVMKKPNIDKKFSRAFAGATSEKALTNNAKKIKIQD